MRAGATGKGGLALLLAASLCLPACGTLREAVYGRENKLAPPASATLGATAREDIVRQYGEPDEIDARWFESFQAEVYFYLDRNDKDGATQYRFLACEFSKGLLTAYAYHEYLDGDGGGFDEKARAGLEKGKSTRREAESRLGAPQGRALLPTTISLPALQMRLGGAPFPLAKLPEGSAEVWQYYSQTFGEGMRKSGQKTLSLFFDAQGLYLGSALLQETAIKSP
jgi:hypothetical protein